MAESREAIRRDIEERRALLRERLDQLEDRVGRSLDLRQRALGQPLVLFGASVATGLLLGRLTGRPQHLALAPTRTSGLSWPQVALTALAVDLLYDAARALAPRLRASLARGPLSSRHVQKETQQMPTPQESLIAWMKDAHALETNVIQTLERHIALAQDHPHISVRMREHLEESRRHADMVEACLARYGEKPSGLKEGLGAMSGMVQGVAAVAAPDTLVKNALGDYTAEHFEIASYTSLMAAAAYLGDSQTVQVCETILRDEMRMAAWLQQQIPLITEEFLGLQAHERGM